MLFRSPFSLPYLSPFLALGKQCPRSKERTSWHLPGCAELCPGPWGPVSPTVLAVHPPEARREQARRGLLLGLEGLRPREPGGAQAPVTMQKASEVVSPDLVQVLFKVTWGINVRAMSKLSSPQHTRDPSPP